MLLAICELLLGKCVHAVAAAARLNMRKPFFTNLVIPHSVLLDLDVEAGLLASASPFSPATMAALTPALTFGGGFAASFVLGSSLAEAAAFSFLAAANLMRFSMSFKSSAL